MHPTTTRKTATLSRLGRERSETFHDSSPAHTCLTLGWVPDGFDITKYPLSKLKQVSDILVHELQFFMTGEKYKEIINQIFATDDIVVNARKIADTLLSKPKPTETLSISIVAGLELSEEACSSLTHGKRASEATLRLSLSGEYSTSNDGISP